MRRLVLGLAIAVAVALPCVGNGDDQQIANYIKSRLQTEQQAGNLKGFSIDMRVDQGTVWFSGYVSNKAQQEMVLGIAQQAGHMGVVQIVDDINVRTPAMASQPMMPTQAQMNTPAMPVGYQEPVYNTPMPVNNTPMPAAQFDGRLVGYNGNPGMMPQPGMMGQGEPMPLPMGYSGEAAMGGMGGAPSMPGYAWPGYAAHPNYAAVTYPKQYSASAWPYIGPFYPYPQVPLGWRKVQLEWDDGWWYLDFKDR
ncbi:MAG: BON domain-containing protein [Pirellulaceae bacterium]|jgi:hypothetical protein|nr:BON domain-containing protein [Pirellulaceae bacterium]